MSRLKLLMLDAPKLVVSFSQCSLCAVCLHTAFHILAGEVPVRFTALTHSCVVIPCSFQQQESTLITKGIWTRKSGGNIYHNAQSQVLDHFKGRTRILGRVGEGNCSLEIDKIQVFDNGPFCFHAEQKKEKYRFNNSCVFVMMKGLLLLLQAFYLFQATYLLILSLTVNSSQSPLTNQ